MLQWGASHLAEKGFDESRLIIELLLAHVLKLKRIQLYTNFDRPLSAEELASFKALLQRRLHHEPLQYIIGSTEFMGYEFLVDRRVLIPRPETELLVEQAVQYVAENFSHQPIRIIDIGTGSGCIAVSLAKMIENVSVVAFDKSAEAVEVARMNAKTNEVEQKVEFTVRDVFTVSSEDFFSKFHLIVSNPPYISTSEFESLQPEIQDYEPSFATTDGGDGLSFYRRIADLGKSLIEPNGAVIVEYAYDQSTAVRGIFLQSGWDNIRLLNDYSGNPRCLIAENSLAAP